jgi:tryptophanyl-tRNA synthetase
METKDMDAKSMVKKMIEQWIKEHQDEKEKARKQIDYWTEIMEREDNYIAYLKTMLNDK